MPVSFEALIRDHQYSVAALLDHQVPTLDAIAAQLTACLKRGGTIYLCGNGGSAADCQHVAGEFVGRFLRERRPYPAVALTTDSSILTAVGNDYGFDQVFARQVTALARPGDVVVGISTSGKSPNILAAVAVAKQIGAKTLAFTGETESPLSHQCDLTFRAPSKQTPRIQELHLLAWHLLCDAVEAALSLPTRPAIFLDRDGTLIEDCNYLSSVEQVKLLPGAAEAVRGFNAAGWAVVLVTNQSGVGRGYFPEERVHEVHNHLQQMLAGEGARLDAICYCPHQPDDNCTCRKPKPGMLLRAAREHDLDLSKSWMIGDKTDDEATGVAAGCQALQVTPQRGLLSAARAAGLLSVTSHLKAA